jgi:hypothetical protein
MITTISLLLHLTDYSLTMNADRIFSTIAKAFHIFDDLPSFFKHLQLSFLIQLLIQVYLLSNGHQQQTSNKIDLSISD